METEIQAYFTYFVNPSEEPRPIAKIDINFI